MKKKSTRMAVPVPSTAYRDVLRLELERRCGLNARYSLRAFARDLGIAASRLSEIMNGKQGMSVGVAEKIAERLGLSKEEREEFCTQVASIHARSRKDREQAQARIRAAQTEDEPHQLKLDAFRVISDWYHLAILEILNLERYRNDTKLIARSLGISDIQLELALDRLERLKLVERRGTEFVPLKGPGLIPGGVPSEAIKKFHGQILDQAKKALVLQSIDEREFQVAILAIDRSKISEAKQEIEKFRRKFCKEIDAAPKKDGLYCFAVQFYNLERATP